MENDKVNIGQSEELNTASQEMQEYVTFSVTTKDGKEVEMAVVDEFEYEKKHYVVGAVIENDVVKEDGLYIYRSVFKGDELLAEKIPAADYQRIAEAYIQM